MMSWLLTRAAVGLALFLACTPTEPCACPPARTSLIVYGEVRTANGAPAPGAALQYVLARPRGVVADGGLCQFDDAVSGDPDPVGTTTDAAGRFRTQIFSPFSPATRCLRVSASGSAGNAQVEGLLVSFRLSNPDSVGLVLRLR